MDGRDVNVDGPPLHPTPTHEYRTYRHTTYIKGVMESSRYKHDALRLMVDTYEGRKASWRRPPGRPRNVWLNKVQEDAGIVESLKIIDVGCNPKQFDVEA